MQRCCLVWKVRNAPHLNVKIITVPRTTVGSKSASRSRSLEFDPDPLLFFFVEIDHKIISTVVLLPLVQEGLLHEVLVNRLIKLAQEKSVVHVR